MTGKEPTITVPLKEYVELFNVAITLDQKGSILAAAQQRIQSAQAAEPQATKLVEK